MEVVLLCVDGGSGVGRLAELQVTIERGLKLNVLSWFPLGLEYQKRLI